MRREHDVLMEGAQPAGGEWNYDSQNRKRLPARTVPPERLRFPPDAITHDVIALVARRFPNHFGELEEFGWPVTREDALRALDDFLAYGLPNFGDYQDAMKAEDALSLSFATLAGVEPRPPYAARSMPRGGGRVAFGRRALECSRRVRAADPRMAGNTCAASTGR